MPITIALVGDDHGHPSHRELNALIARLKVELDVNARWVPTSGNVDVSGFDGVWLVPGSPYDDDAAAYSAITTARTGGIPFLGTCGGMQYAVIEYLRNVLDQNATHAESDGQGADNAVAATVCSLQGVRQLVTPQTGSRFAEWVHEPFEGMHYCDFAPTREAVERLRVAGVTIGAVAPDGMAEELEFPGHPFFVTSLFQPHIGASAGEPIHPIIQAFLQAAAA